MLVQLPLVWIFHQANSSAKSSLHAYFPTGIDVSSNQDDEELSEKDIFQLEYDAASKKWKFLASNGKYWVMQGVGVQANGEGRWEK